jgi:hypothetical protein
LDHVLEFPEEVAWLGTAGKVVSLAREAREIISLVQAFKSACLAVEDSSLGLLLQE